MSGTPHLLVVLMFFSLLFEVAAQAPMEHESYRDAFREQFDMTEPAFNTRIRRLRSFGWTAFGLFSTAFVMPSIQRAAFGSGTLASDSAWLITSGALLTISGALLLRARAMVIRRRRFRERQAALDRSYFHPELDIGITPGGLSLHLSF